MKGIGRGGGLWHGWRMSLSLSPVRVALVGAAVLLGSLALRPSDAVLAQQAPSGPPESFEAYKQTLIRRAQTEGVRQATIDAVIPGLMPNQRVIALDRNQPDGSPNKPIPDFAPYRRSHVDAARINGGRAKYAQLRPFLEKVERETGVPEAIMISIYGNETHYGRVTGNYDVPEALATLAWEGRRRSLFEGEFMATLKMMDRGVPRYKLKGSWAGAMGYPQFLPSVYIRLARDGDGDGMADIWSSEADALASIANYFRNSGWRSGMDWGMEVSVPSGLDRAAIASRQVAPRCARVFGRHSMWKSVGEWKALGVRPLGTGKSLKDSDLATLLEPDGPQSTGFLLTGNYRVILDYNCSNFYGLAVGLLSDAVESQ